jgi:hypothetical protein
MTEGYVVNVTVATLNVRGLKMQGNTCGGCARVWVSRRAAHCSACHETFANDVGFMAHRWHRGRGDGCYGVDEFDVIMLEWDEEEDVWLHRG